MSNESSINLFAEFPAASPADWRAAAEASLAGAPFEKKLITRTPEGVAIQPIYTAEDTADLPERWPGLAPFVRGGTPLGQRREGWAICQEPDGSNATAFNQALLHDLQRGQNAVSLPVHPAVRRGTDPAATAGRGLMATDATVLRQALHGVDLSAVPLFAQAGVSALPLTKALVAVLAAQGRPATDLHGAVLADPMGELLAAGALPSTLEHALDEMAQLVSWVGANQLDLRTVGVRGDQWTDAGASATEELAFSLATGVAYLREMARRDIAIDEAASRVLFTFGLGSNLFMEIAKLRAARLLWARAVDAAGGTAAAQRLVCHGRTTRWNKTALDIHVNLLRTTTEAFAGIVGGCSGLQVGAFDECVRAPDEVSRRLARNIQIILAEECQLGRVVDPAGGSWYVESLTKELANKAWTLFQEVERKGGMIAAVSGGWPQAQVEKTAASRLSSVETRRDGIIGTNLHPNLRDQLPPVETVAPAVAAKGAIEVKPLVARRRAEPFEALRRRSAAYQQKTGSLPKVYLATFGPRKQHAARADFSAGFFAAGGFEAVRGKSSDAPEAAAQAALASGAPVVVLCSSDDTYPTLVPPSAKALKASAKPPIVVLAGAPATPELQAEYQAAGVDEFIHLRANCAQLLSGILSNLGL